MTRAFSILLFTGACLLPVACGGGGATETVLLAPQNAVATAGQGLEAVELLTQMTDLVGGFMTTFEGGAQSLPCDAGNMSLTLNDVAPQGQLSQGDSATFVFQACSFGEGEDIVTLNGRLTLRATTVQGAPPAPFAVAMSVSFSNLTVTGPTGVVSVDGGMTLEASSNDALTFFTAVSGSYFSAFVQEGLESRSVTLRNFRLSQDFNDESGSYTGTLAAVITSSAIGGTVSYATPEPFTGVEPNDPSSGLFVVTGAAGSTLMLDVLDEENVRLLLDIDGDGTPDVTIDTTWDDLRN